MQCLKCVSISKRMYKCKYCYWLRNMGSLFRTIGNIGNKIWLTRHGRRFVVARRTLKNREGSFAYFSRVTAQLYKFWCRNANVKQVGITKMLYLKKAKTTPCSSIRACSSTSLKCSIQASNIQFLKVGEARHIRKS